MMPLLMAKTGETNSVKKVGGKEETRQFLAKLGLIPGSRVTVITAISGNVIVSVKESRVALSREMAGKIMVQADLSGTRPDKRFANYKETDR